MLADNEEEKKHMVEFSWGEWGKQFISKRWTINIHHFLFSLISRNYDRNTFFEASLGHFSPQRLKIIIKNK